MTEHAHSPSVAGGKILKSDRFDALRSFGGGVARAQTEAARLLTEAKAEGARLREAALNEGKAAAAALMVEHSRRIEADLKALDAALPAYAAAGMNLSINLHGAMWANFAAAYSDYHVTGLNPAGNACLADLAFVAARFRIVQHRRPAKEHPDAA